MVDIFDSVVFDAIPGQIGGTSALTYSEETVPDGGTFIDIAGPQPEHISLSCFFPSYGAMTALKHKVGTTGKLNVGATLDIHGDPTGGWIDEAAALLVTVTPTGSAPLGESWATAEWVVT